VVQVFQHFIGQIQAVKLPETVIATIIVELPARNFNRTPTVPTLVRLEAVFPGQDSVLEFQKEGAGSPPAARDREAARPSGFNLLD